MSDPKNPELWSIIGQPDLALTGKKACTFIAKVTHIMRPSDPVVEPREIWEASKTGDLVHIQGLFSICRQWVKTNELSPEALLDIISIFKENTDGTKEIIQESTSDHTGAS